MITYSSSSSALYSTTSFSFLLDFTGPCFMQCLGALGGLGAYSSVEGDVALSLSSLRNCLAASALLQMASTLQEFWCQFGGGWDSLSFRKLLEECWVIGINGEVILSMFMSMVLPGRGTVPTHFGAVIEATI